MAVIEAVLAVIGLVLLVLVAWWALTVPAQEPPKTYVVEFNSPAWEGLLAAARLQQTAQELERQINAEAVRHRLTELMPSPDHRDR